MVRSFRQTIGIEAAIGGLINGVLSLIFVMAVFGGKQAVPVAGWSGLTGDAVPQTFMVSVMSLLVPRLLTRKRLLHARGPSVTGGTMPSAFGIIRSSLIVAVLLTVALAGLQYLILPALLPRFCPFGQVLAFKIVYGAVLGAAVAAVGVGHLLTRSGLASLAEDPV